MDIINFTQADCKNCYKCVRSCKVKSIKVKNGQAQIDNDLCIGCGTCLAVCPQNAKTIISDLSLIKEFLSKGKKIAVSLAPSFPTAFAIDEPLKLICALKHLGFDIIEETSVGAKIVSREYKKLFISSKAKHIFTTSCPTANYLVETCYPDKIPYLAPVTSPMIAHGRILKKRYPDHKLIFIGPCISKKFEANKSPCHIYDGIMTFDELRHWLDEEDIDVSSFSPTPSDNEYMGLFRWYPVAGGIIKSTFDDSDHIRKILKVDGLNDAIDLIENLDDDFNEPTWVEINACGEGCINGPGNLLSPYGKSKRSDKIVEYINQEDAFSSYPEQEIIDVDLSCKFYDRKKNLPLPDESEILAILSDIGKHKESDELNCGTCGYDTCRQKAIAVYQGMAEKEMCLPYMRNKGETLSSLIISSTPNGVFVTDKYFNIIESNPAAEKIFSKYSGKILYSSALSILKDLDFDYIKRNCQHIDEEIDYLADFDLYIKYTVRYMEKQELYIFIFNDITQQTKHREQIKTMRDNTLDMAQEVIDKQMRVAQEIASLLGETTAETKVTLTQLKRLVQEEDGE